MPAYPQHIPDSWRNADLHEHTERLLACEHCGKRISSEDELEMGLCSVCIRKDFEGGDKDD